MSRNPVADQLSSVKSANPYSTTATASNGAPVPTLTASMTAGPQGSIVIQDFTLVDHIAAFDRERISRLCLAIEGFDCSDAEGDRLLRQSLKEIDYLLSKFPE